jgi:hypothetical protein
MVDIPCTKINSKRVKDLKVRPKTIKLLEENVKVKLYEIRFVEDFLDVTPKTQATEIEIGEYYIRF